MHELFWWHYNVSCALISEHFCKTFTGIKESSIQNLHSFFPPYLKLSRYERINVCSHSTCKSIDFRGLFCWRKMCKQNLLYWKRVKRWNRGTECCHDHRAISWFPFLFSCCSEVHSILSRACRPIGGVGRACSAILCGLQLQRHRAVDQGWLGSWHWRGSTRWVENKVSVLQFQRGGGCCIQKSPLCCPNSNSSFKHHRQKVTT